MVSWKSINHLSFFGGGIVGKKFYPDASSSTIPFYKSGLSTALPGTNPVYRLSRGYFSSVRPGIGADNRRTLAEWAMQMEILSKRRKKRSSGVE
ncbi:hypothetical protein WAI453_001675 [Rhynchosporium graminicola]